MQVYKQEDIQKIKSELNALRQRYSGLLFKIFELSGKLKEEKAKEYLHHGVGRRLGIIKQCVENIFSIFPVDRKKLLDNEELANIDINLHAFLVNIFGLLDNLAWVLVHEKKLTGIIDKKQVGVFMKETKKHFSSSFRQYLDSDRMQNWHNQYLKNYRDALSHRIPLYVPPKMINAEQAKQITQIENNITDCLKSKNLDSIAKFNAIDKLRIEQNNIGSVCPVFAHDDEGGIVLHAQLIADFNTIEEIVEKYCETFLG